MKRSFIMIVVAAVAMLAVLSCKKEADSPETGDSSKISISVTAEMEDLGESDVKASIGTVYRLSWENSGDKVFVYDGTDCLGSLTVSLKDGDKRYAYLGGTITAPTDGSTKLTCIYAKGITDAPKVVEGKVKFSMANQTAGDTPFVVYGTIDYSTGQTSITDKLVNFEFATAVVLVNCLDLAADGGNVTKAELSGINTNCVLSLSGTVAPDVVEDTEVGTIVTNGTFPSGNGKLTYPIGIPASPEAETQRKLIITQQTKTMSTNFTSKKFAAEEFETVIYTLEEYTPPTPPADGSLPGVFTINGKKIKFSQGNLQYQPSTQTWRFAEHQFDYIGISSNTDGSEGNMGSDNDNKRITDTSYMGWIDLFGWATSGYNNPGAERTAYLPTATNGTQSDYWINSDYSKSITREDYTDWGVNIKGNWRTPTSVEWEALKNRENGWASCHLTIHDDNVNVNVLDAQYVLLLFPDDWNNPDGIYSGPYNNTINSTSLNDVILSLIQFNKLQKSGVVLLPPTATRNGTSLKNASAGRLFYWSATSTNTSGNTSNSAYFIKNRDNSNNYSFFVDFGSDGKKYYGMAVRLVTDVPSDSN